MYKWLGAIAALLVAAFFCMGSFDNVQTDYISHKVKPGETLNGIAAKYYSLNTKGYIPADDFALMVRLNNSKLHNMDRKLQIGDEVMVPIYTKK